MIYHLKSGTESMQLKIMNSSISFQNSPSLCTLDKNTRLSSLGSRQEISFKICLLSLPIIKAKCNTKFLIKKRNRSKWISQTILHDISIYVKSFFPILHHKLIILLHQHFLQLQIPLSLFQIGTKVFFSPSTRLVLVKITNWNMSEHFQYNIVPMQIAVFILQLHFLMTI